MSVTKPMRAGWYTDTTTVGERRPVPSRSSEPCAARQGQGHPCHPPRARPVAGGIALTVRELQEEGGR
jgi:hypothetical protein